MSYMSQQPVIPSYSDEELDGIVHYPGFPVKIFYTDCEDPILGKLTLRGSHDGVILSELEAFSKFTRLQSIVRNNDFTRRKSL